MVAYIYTNKQNALIRMGSAEVACDLANVPHLEGVSVLIFDSMNVSREVVLSALSKHNAQIDPTDICTIIIQTSVRIRNYKFSIHQKRENEKVAEMIPLEVKELEKEQPLHYHSYILYLFHLYLLTLQK